MDADARDSKRQRTRDKSTNAKTRHRASSRPSARRREQGRMVAGTEIIRKVCTAVGWVSYTVARGTRRLRRRVACRFPCCVG